MSTWATKLGTQELSRNATSNGRRLDPIRWYEGAPNPGLAAVAAEFELKGNRGSARTLASKTVSIAGLGAVGGETLCTLSRLGVGNLIGIDFDSYEAESWLTQPANPTDAGRLKAEVQGERAHACGSSHVLTAVAFAQDIPLWILLQSDALLVAGDNLEILVWAGEMACRLGIPLLQGAVDGETWTAFVRAYNLGEEGSPCPACAFSQADWLRQKSRAGCDPGMMRAQGEESTRTLPNVCRTAAAILSSETAKELLQIEGRLVSEELSYCLLSHRTLRTKVEQNPDCRCPHRRWQIAKLDRARDDTTITMLVTELGDGQRLERLQVRGELPWISYSCCVQCGRQVPIQQFGKVGAELGDCPCGETLYAIPMGMRSTIPPGDLRNVADKTLEDLQLPAGAAIGLDDAEGSGKPNWFFVGPPPPLQTEPLPQHGEGTKNENLNRSKAK